MIQSVIPSIVRPHLEPPKAESVTYTTAASTERGGFLDIGPQSEPLRIEGYAIPGALMLTKQARLFDSSGTQVTTNQVKECMTGQEPAQTQACVAGKNLHFTLSYQPADRYWTFQWIEFAGFLLLTMIAGALAFWRIRRVRG